ncbi:MAG: metallophosphoesterase [Actinomycetia bacterium]|nr:metallophosphoesterase [Actinomycetes bacterium]
MTRILHLSDTHLHAPEAETLHPEIDARARLEKVLEQVRSYGPFDAVVVTGDVCDDGSQVGAADVHELIKGLAPVVLAVPGNHDLADPVRSVFGEPHAEVGPWTIVGVQTQIEQQVHGDGSAVPAALAELGERPVILLMHHPISSRSTHEWFSLEHREEAAAAVESYPGPLVVLSGHTHEAFEGRLGTAHLLGAPSTYYSIRHDGEEFEFVATAHGAQVVNLDDDQRSAEVEVVLLEEPQDGIADRISTHVTDERP